MAGGLVTKQTAQLIAADINYPLPANLSRMGLIVKADEAQVEDLLKKVTPDWKKVSEQIAGNLELQNDKNSDPRKHQVIVEKKISLLLGWYMATGIREELHSIQAKAAESGSNLPTEMSIYHDMHVLKQIAGKNERASVADVQLLFHGIQPRMIGRTHTLTPDYDDGIEWTVRITDWRNDTKILMEKYAQAYVNPDKNKIEHYITKPNFYNPDDKLIQLARWVHDGKYIKRIKNIDDIKGYHSLYTRSLAKGILALQKADQILMEGGS